MARPFRRIIEELPVERRERIEAHTNVLIKEYELLKALRQDCRVSQEQLAELMGIRQASVSKIENQDDMRLSTLRKYIEALGGELEILVRFPDRDVSLDPFPHQNTR
ncbi:XRE family transcriptional regulator [soil metagenome]